MNLDTRAEMHAGDSGISKLLQWHVYAAEFIDLAAEPSKGGKHNPRVEIIVDSSGETYYWGFVLPPIWKEGKSEIREERRRKYESSVSLRDKLIMEGKEAGRINMKVIGVPQNNIVGPYMLLATDEKPTTPLESIADTIIAPAPESLVLPGKSLLEEGVVFYAKYISSGVVEVCNSGGMGILRAAEKPVFGDPSYRIKGELYRITSEMINGLKSNDYLIVRQIDIGSGVENVFEPVVNFRESDEETISDKPLLTTVVKKKIYNLPIVSLHQRRGGRGGVFGLGYVPDEEGNPCHRLVRVRGARNYRGKFIEKLKITGEYADFLTAKIVT